MNLFAAKLAYFKKLMPIRTIRKTKENFFVFVKQRKLVRKSDTNQLLSKSVNGTVLYRVLTLCTLLLLLGSSEIHAILPPKHTGNFFVTSFNTDSIAVYNSLGTYLFSFSAPGLDGPRGIVFAPNNKMYIASQRTNEVFIFDLENNFITKFADAQLDGPTGMAVSDSNELYVCSFDNDQVVVFDLDGNMLRIFTGGGMNGPNCIAFTTNGNSYVSSAMTATIIRFDANENFVTTFTGGGLSSPMGIARDTSDVLYVAGGGSNNIVKFNLNGNFLGSINHSDLTGPQGVAIDDRGHQFSSSFYQNQIVEFDAAGNYEQTITDGGLQVPRSIAFQALETTTANTRPDITFSKRFTLNQNIPNPFNSTTSIRYTVPSGGRNIIIQIFDLNGRLVKKLADEWQAAGEKTSLWNGTNQRGLNVSSGIYLYRLTTNNFSETRKMLLLQ